MESKKITILYKKIMRSKWRLERDEELRAAIERKPFERGLRVLGFGATPFGCPFSFRNEQSVFTVLFLPHLPLPLWASNSEAGESLQFRAPEEENNFSFATTPIQNLAKVSEDDFVVDMSSSEFESVTRQAIILIQFDVSVCFSNY